MGYLFTLPSRRDDKSGRFYHFTSNLDLIQGSGVLWGGADGTVYAVAHRDNYKLGLTARLERLQVVVFQPDCGIHFRKKPLLPLYDFWKRARGEYTSKFACDIEIHEARLSTLAVGGTQIPALVIDHASYLPQRGDVLKLSRVRLLTRHVFTGFEAYCCSLFLIPYYPMLCLTLLILQYGVLSPMGTAICLYLGKKTGRQSWSSIIRSWRSQKAS